MRKGRITTTIALMLLSASLMFAADAESLYSDFHQAVDNGDVAQAIEAYDDLQDRIAKEADDIRHDIDKAVDKHDGRLYASSIQALRKLGSYSIKKEDSDALLTAIVNSDSPDAAQWAQWLYENSRYYHPTLTLSTDISQDGYRSSYRRTVSVAPGSEVTLPDSTGGDTSRTGVLTGWGITPDEVTYESGETITMPYTDQTLFAVYTSRVSFEDGDGDNVTTYDDVSEGDVVDIPAPAAQGEAIFEGWYDRSSGQYLSPDETQYTVRGMGADFTALYSKLEAKEISTGHWNTGAIPTGTQIPLTFTLANSGTEDEDGIQVTVSSDSAYARLMNTSAYVRSMDAGDVRTLKGVLLVVDSECPSGQEIPVTVTMSDDDGAVFTSTFTLTTR